MRGGDREFGINMYTLLYKMDNKVLLYSIGSTVQCYVAAWMRGEFGEEWTYIYM